MIFKTLVFFFILIRLNIGVKNYRLWKKSGVLLLIVPCNPSFNKPSVTQTFHRCCRRHQIVITFRVAFFFIHVLSHSWVPFPSYSKRARKVGADSDVKKFYIRGRVRGPLDSKSGIEIIKIVTNLF